VSEIVLSGIRVQLIKFAQSRASTSNQKNIFILTHGNFSTLPKYYQVNITHTVVSPNTFYTTVTAAFAGVLRQQV